VDDAGTTIEAELASNGTAVVAFVGASIFSGELNAAGVSVVDFQGSSTGLVFADFNATGVATVQFNSTALFSSVLNANGVATVNFVGEAVSGSILSADFNAVGVATVIFESAVVAGFSEAVLNAVGSSLVLFFGGDANVPEGTPGNLFVPIRYVVGMTANVVPVETVLVGGIGVVPVREFIGPANVVPVREVSSETPRVKVVKV
jgi:hypothetical protein